MKYQVDAVLTISVNCTVEASSKEEAEEKAEELGVIGLCFECGGGDPESEWCTSGELDGVPRELEVTKCE